MKQLGFVCVGVLCALGAISFADPPGWSRGQQELPITWEECVKRAGAALQGEGYRVDQPSPFAVGLKGQHTAVIMCNPAPANKQWVNIVVASNGEGGGTERQRLQARMEGSAANPPPPPPPPPGEACTGPDWSITTSPGTVKKGQPFTMSFLAKGRVNNRDWISIYRLTDPPDKHLGHWEYASNHKPKCGWTFTLHQPGTYGVAYLLNDGTEWKAKTTITITDDASAQNRVTPPPPPAKAVQYMGCFKDSNSPFDLDGHLERSGQNTPQRCIATCAAKGFAYAGVQYAQSCLCGNRYGTQGQATNCNMACTGDPNQTCGGGNANSVYSTGR
jgi:hypothetical protein